MQRPGFLGEENKLGLHSLKKLGLKWNLGRCPEVFCKKGVLKYLLKFSGKYLYQSLFFEKVIQARGLQHR